MLKFLWFAVIVVDLNKHILTGRWEWTLILWTLLTWALMFFWHAFVLLSLFLFLSLSRIGIFRIHFINPVMLTVRIFETLLSVNVVTINTDEESHFMNLLFFSFCSFIFCEVDVLVVVGKLLFWSFWLTVSCGNVLDDYVSCVVIFIVVVFVTKIAVIIKLNIESLMMLHIHSRVHNNPIVVMHTFSISASTCNIRPHRIIIRKIIGWLVCQ